MATTDIEPSELTKWDPGLTERVMGIIRPFLKRYFRSEVRGLENMPPGGALLVCNHSGGMLPMDVPILAADFYEQYGYDRPLYTLSHDMLMTGPTGRLLQARSATSAPTTRTPTRRCAPAASSWCSPAATTTCTGRRCRRTRSTSAAAPAT